MTHPAAYELCQELYDLSSDGISGWGEDSRDVWRNNLSLDGKDSKIEVREREFTPRGSELCPAYTLGYLFRKLPPSIKVELAKRVFYEDTGEWSIDLTAYYGDSFYWTEDFSTPEDALASLLIRLIKDKDVDDVETN